MAIETGDDEESEPEDIICGIVEQVANEAGVSPTEIPPLYEAVDPEAVAELLDGQGRKVEFRYNGYLVVVGNNGEIDVSNPTTYSGADRIQAPVIHQLTDWSFHRTPPNSTI